MRIIFLHIILALHLFWVDAGEENDEFELLEAAENGRYKVVAKAEPYKNLPPAPVTPDTFSDVTSPAPKSKNLPTTHQDLKFEQMKDAKTQKFVPVRQTPVYIVTTPSYNNPTYSPTPPAIEFVTKSNKDVKKKSPPTPGTGIFKISVKNVDFLPTPAPSKNFKDTPTNKQRKSNPSPQPKSNHMVEREMKKEKKKHVTESDNNSRVRMDKKVARVQKQDVDKRKSLKVENRKKNKKGRQLEQKELGLSSMRKEKNVLHPMGQFTLRVQDEINLNVQAKKECDRPKDKSKGKIEKSAIEFNKKQQALKQNFDHQKLNNHHIHTQKIFKPVHKNHINYQEIVVTKVRNNEIAASLKNAKLNIVPKSIYDPRPRTRTYTKNFNKNVRKKHSRGSKSYTVNYKKKNWKLPIRNNNIKKPKGKKRKKYDPYVLGYEIEKKPFQTVKRQQPNEIEDLYSNDYISRVTSDSESDHRKELDMKSIPGNSSHLNASTKVNTNIDSSRLKKPVAVFEKDYTDPPFTAFYKLGPLSNIYHEKK